MTLVYIFEDILISAIIANNSDMGALVFDPKREPETPVLPSEEESTENAPRWPTPQSRYFYLKYFVHG